MVMSANTVRSFVASLVIFALAACAESPQLTGQARLGDQDNGRTITLKAGEIVEVCLESNPSTGYSWSLLTEPNKAIVTTVSQVMEGAAVPMPGAGGTDHWKFKAVAPGETGLVLVYKRGWEKLSEEDQRFTLTLKVSDLAGQP